jgi:hypothetical protein
MHTGHISDGIKLVQQVCTALQYDYQGAGDH